MTTTLRLFAAIVPPEEALGSLAAELARIRERCADQPGALRWIPRPRWHLTLAFYGSDDVGVRTEWLRERLAGCSAVRLHVEAAGTFPGVLWMGVHGDVAALAGAAATEEHGRPYHAHLTIARWKAPRRPRVARRAADALAGYRGPSWRAGEVVLMSSELGGSGPRYTVRERFQLN